MYIGEERKAHACYDVSPHSAPELGVSKDIQKWNKMLLGRIVFWIRLKALTYFRKRVWVCLMKCLIDEVLIVERGINN